MNSDKIAEHLEEAARLLREKPQQEQGDLRELLDQVVRTLEVASFSGLAARLREAAKTITQPQESEERIALREYVAAVEAYLGGRTPNAFRWAVAPQTNRVKEADTKARRILGMEE